MCFAGMQKMMQGVSSTSGSGADAGNPIIPAGPSGAAMPVAAVAPVTVPPAGSPSTSTATALASLPPMTGRASASARA